MSPWWLNVMGGLLGSSHCIGMCGGFAAIIGLRRKSVAGNFRDQMIYSFGRLASYATLGGAAGFAGQRMIAALPSIINVPALLCLIAGVFLIREGLVASGLLRRRISGTSASGCLIRPLFSSILRKPGMTSTFLAGTVTGLLPCGLVYSFVSLAASSGDFLQGISTMVQFGCGTVPLMVLTGCGSAFLNWSARQALWKFAGWSVLITGLLTVGRGAAFLQWETPQKPVCPFCRVSPTASAQSQSSISSQ